MIAKLQQADPETAAAADILAELWTQNAGLVRQTVHRMTGLNYHDPDFLDMEQQAYFGLHAAAYAYDPAGKLKFSTYAVKRIEWELSRYYSGNGYAVRVPAYMRKRIKDALRRRREREQAEGRRVPLESVLADMGLSPQEVQTTLAAYQKAEIQSIDAPAPGTDGLTIGDTIAAEDSTEGAGMGQEWHRELHSTLRCALQEVPAARGVIVRHYFSGVSLAAQARETGLTLEALRQREHRAFRKIRRGKYAAALAEFASTESERQRMARLIEREREALELIDLSERERGLLL